MEQNYKFLSIWPILLYPLPALIFQLLYHWTYLITFVSFNSTLQLMNGISSDRQELLRYLNSTAIVTFLKIYYLHLQLCFLNLDLYLKRFQIIIIRNVCIKNSCFLFRIKPWTTCRVRIIYYILLLRIIDCCSVNFCYTQFLSATEVGVLCAVEYYVWWYHPLLV